MKRFDKAIIKKLVKQKYGTFENFRDILESEYNLERKLNTVQKWGQVNNPNVPLSTDLPVIASALDLSVIDLYENSTEAREEIVLEEIRKNPEKFLKQLKTALEKLDYSDELLHQLKEARES